MPADGDYPTGEEDEDGDVRSFSFYLIYNSSLPTWVTSSFINDITSSVSILLCLAIQSDRHGNVRAFSHIT